jgi:hypothetical protein
VYFLLAASDGVSSVAVGTGAFEGEETRLEVFKDGA